jgi:RimJ/RimL family protein N-acetyltransferase
MSNKFESLEEIELKFRNSEISNFPGYKHPPQFRPLDRSDSLKLSPILRKNSKSISTYLSKFSNSDKWGFKDANSFVLRLLRDQRFPSFHYVFTCGGEIVALGSLVSYGEDKDCCQVVLAVFGDHQGKGWGKVVAQTLIRIAFDIWGFDRLYWINDATNIASSRLAQGIGCELDAMYEDSHIMGDSGSGLWMRWVAYRPHEEMAPGVLQGAPIEYWVMPKSINLLEAKIKN